MEELTATFLGERIRFDGSDVVVGDAAIPEGKERPERLNGDPCFAVKGEDENEELKPYLTYRFYGRWKRYKNRRTGKEEDQFNFQTFVRDQPHGRAGVIAYLRQAGEGNGIGVARASRLFDKFGSDAVRILREQPEVVAAAVKGISIEQCQAASEWLRREKALEGCTIELIDLLHGRGFPRKISKQAVSEWGNRAAQMIKRDPYRLMAFRGCGFKRCDAMYLDLGLPPERLKRQTLCAWYSIASDTEGHTWYPLKKAVMGIQGSVSGARIQPAKAMMLAKRGRALAIKRTDGPHGQLVESGGFIWVAEFAKAKHEKQVASSISEALAEHCVWNFDASEFPAELSEHQLANLRKCLAGTVAILGGSPGTGKTYTAAALIRLLSSRFGAESIAVAAPTGKAAVRISEALAEYRLPMRARTIHSLLRVVSASGHWQFEHGESNPLPHRFIVVDESSMLGTSLMNSLLAARAMGTHILFVGDINQLPPVEHGAPIRDMIAAGVPFGELREIKRNAGRIVRACAQIRDGERFDVSQTVDLDSGENLKMVECHGHETQIKKTLQAIEIARKMSYDPIWDCQVIVAVNKKSKISRKEVNKVLQQELNPNPPVQGSPFRVGDKIVNTKNGFFPIVDIDRTDEDVQTNEKDEVYVANGELAEVLVAEQKRTVAKLANPERTIVIPRSSEDKDDESIDGKEESSDTGCAWNLGFAISCHKSQGSEWPIVIVLIDEYPGARMVCSREWIYTAISRARNLCILVGKHRTAHQFCRQTKLTQRKTFLRELICKNAMS